MPAARPRPYPLEPDPLDPAMVLTHADVDALGRLCRSRIVTLEDLVRVVGNLSTLSVEGIPITLEPRLLTRLKSRCLDKPNFPAWLRDLVIRQLHDWAGW